MKSMMMLSSFVQVSANRLWTLAAIAIAALPLTAGAAIDSSAPFQVFPPEVNLTYKQDRQSVVVRWTEANGVHRDVTAAAKLSLTDPTKARIEGGVVLPVADGQTTLKVEWNGKTAEI